MSSRTLSLAALLLVGLPARQALSQTPPEAPSADAAKAESRSIDEVVVTAGKLGAQRLQDIPASISVLDQSRIENAGIDDFIDYVRTIPGLGFQLTTAAGGRDDIRGGRRFQSARHRVRLRLRAHHGVLPR